MYLYDNGDNGKVLIYEMNKGNKLELVDYRLNKLINQNNKVFRFLTNEKVPPFDFDEASKRVVSDFLYDDIFYEKKAFLSSKYHLLEPSPQSDNDDFESLYHYGKYDDAPLIRIFKHNGDLKRFNVAHTFLVGSDYEYTDLDDKNSCIYNVISLTEEVFNLELLIRGQFSLVSDSADITEQVHLFEFSEEPVYEVDPCQLNLYENLGLVHRTDDVGTKINQSQKILKYARSEGLIKK